MKRDTQYWVTKLSPFVIVAVVVMVLVHVAIQVTKYILGIPPS